MNFKEAGVRGHCLPQGRGRGGGEEERKGGGETKRIKGK